jgi:lysozyme
MNLTSRHALRNDVMGAEGFRQFPYFDCCGKPYRSCTCPRKGKLTIGFGRNLDDVGLSKLEAEVLLDHDLHTAEQTANRMFDWFGSLSELRQRAVAELLYNVGAAGVRTFRQMLLAIKVKQFKVAAAHLLDSRWRTQVGPTRSQRIARYLGDGD